MPKPWEINWNASQVPGGTIFRDPNESREQARKDEELRLRQEAAARAAADDARQQEEARRKQLEFEATHLPDGTPKPSLASTPKQTAQVRQQALGQFNAALDIDRILKDLRTQYANGPGATHGVFGLQDFLYTPTNQTFDATANQARGIVRNALGLTGGEANTAAEANMNLGGYLPQASDFDVNIANKFQNLEGLRDRARRQAIQTLGGIPDANGNIMPIPAQNAMNQTFLAQGDPLQAAAAGATTGIAPVPPDMQREYDAYLAKNIRNLDPDDYVSFRLKLDKKYGYPSDPAKTEEYRQWAVGAAQAGKQGGTVKTQIPGTPRKLSTTEQLRNSAVNNPVGGFVVGAANMGGFGFPQAFAPQQFQALSNAQSLPMTLGAIGGSVAGTTGLGKLGANTIGRAVPRLLGGSGKAQVARNLATDAAYSSIYGGVTGQDPVTSGAVGALGSGAGQAVGRGIGAAIGGVAASPAVQALRARGIPLTVGQVTGGVPKALEDAGTSVPGIGDIINARRLEGLRAFNQSALNEAGSPIGAKVADTGELGVESLIDQIGNSYDDATRGVSVPLDDQFVQELAELRARGAKLPPDLAGKFDAALANRVDPLLESGEMTGEQFQQAVRGLRGYRAEHTKPGFEEDYRNALKQAIEVLTGPMERGGGARTVQGLERANQAFKGAKVVQRAVQAAKNGSGTGVVQIFTPAQLNTAAQQAANKFGGRRPMAPLIDAAQATLPSRVPDSGTARRLLTASIPTLGGAGIGAGVGAASGNTQEGLQKGLALGTILALGGTKAGQSVLTKLLADRPDVARKLGGIIRQHKGLLGKASLPLLLQ